MNKNIALILLAPLALACGCGKPVSSASTPPPVQADATPKNQPELPSKVSAAPSGNLRSNWEPFDFLHPQNDPQAYVNRVLAAQSRQQQLEYEQEMREQIEFERQQREAYQQQVAWQRRQMMEIMQRSRQAEAEANQQIQDAGYFQRLQRSSGLSGASAEGVLPGTFAPY